MKTRKPGILALVVFAMLLSACDSTSSGTTNGTQATGAATTCSGYFEATASDDGTMLWQGTLALNIQASGDFTGSFTPKAGSSPAFTASQITGQAVGHSISLAVDLGGDKYLFGTGSLTQPASSCKGVGGGSFVVETVNKSSGSKNFNGLAAPDFNPILQNQKDHTVGTWGYASGG
jgi:hypothetical protein